MLRFSYRALSAEGQITKGSLSALTREAAEMQLRGDGLVPLDLEQRKARSQLGQVLTLGPSKRPRHRDVILFTREMSTLLGAALPLDRSLRLLSTQGDGPMSRIASEALDAISGGESLSQALGARPDVFSSFYLGMVRSGEASGRVGVAMERLHEMLAKQEQLTQKVRSALTYPVIVLALTALSMVILLVLVIPQFGPLFDRSHGGLGISTRVVLAASDFVRDWGLLAAGVGLALVLAALRLRLPPKARVRRDKALLRIPVVGSMLRALEVGRFCRILGTLRQNGVTMIDAMPIAAGTVRNAAVAGAMQHVQGPLSRGEGLAAPLAALDVVPEMALEMIAVGEETGQLDDMLLEAAAMLDDEADRKIQSALSLLVPGVTVILGIIVASVIGSILSAILGTYRLAL